MRVTNLTLFGIMLGLSIYSLVYIINQSYILAFTLFEINFFSLCAAIIYLLFLFVYEFKQNNESALISSYDNIASDSNQLFMTTHFSKFLFPIFYGNLFIWFCLELLGKNFVFFTGQTFFFCIVQLHINVFLPIFMLVELYWLIDHHRAPRYVTDKIILSAILLIRWAIALIFKSILINGYSLGDSVRDLGTTLISLLLAINGYYLYDYLLFRKQNPGERYSISIGN